MNQYIYEVEWYGFNYVTNEDVLDIAYIQIVANDRLDAELYFNDDKAATCVILHHNDNISIDGLKPLRLLGKRDCEYGDELHAMKCLHCQPALLTPVPYWK